MSEHVDRQESMEERLTPVRRPRVSIFEVMWLVAAVAVSLRWPGLSVPMGLLFLDALARRRDILRRPTRVALGQVALALYLPTAVVIFWTLPEWWDTYTNYFSLMPTYCLATLVLSLSRVVPMTRFSPGDTIGMVVLSLVPLLVIGGLGLVARRGLAWRIPCLILAAGMSAFSSFVFIIVFSMPT